MIGKDSLWIGKGKELRCLEYSRFMVPYVFQKREIDKNQRFQGQQNLYNAAGDSGFLLHFPNAMNTTFDEGQKVCPLSPWDCSVHIFSIMIQIRIYSELTMEAMR